MDISTNPLKKHMSQLFKKFLTNKVVIYIVTRYLTYFLQFLFSMFIAIKLGPYHFGIWGFILMVLNYISLLNFGITNSVNVLLVHHKKSSIKSNDLVKTSMYLVAGICLVLILFAFYYYIFDIPYFSKYEMKVFFYLVVIIGILTHYNNLFITIFRVKNDVYKISFSQSIIPILCFIVIFIFNKDSLIRVLLYSYIIGNLFSLALFIFDKKMQFNGNYKKEDTSELLKKGGFLFIYNTSFYFIMISTKSIISYFFKVEEFGYFTFTYTLANSILLMLNAFSFIILPKMIDALSSKDTNKIRKNLKIIRDNYITLAHGLMYLVITFFPLILSLFPQYNSTNALFHYMCLALLMNVNAFGFNTFLMAQNKEKLLATISFSALITNVLINLFLVVTIKVAYEYVIIGTLLSYFLYSLSLVFFGEKIILKSFSLDRVFKSFMPYNLLLPFLFSICINILELSNIFNILNVILFLSLNFNKIKTILIITKKIVEKPNIINI